jgi:hypothetical protein
MSNLKRFLNDKVGQTEAEKSIDRNKFPEFYPESRSPFYSVMKTLDDLSATLHFL